MRGLLLPAARRAGVVLAVALAASACSTVSQTLETDPGDAVAFSDEPTVASDSDEADPDDVTTDESDGTNDGTEQPTTTATSFPPAPEGPTIVVAGPDGVVWFDGDGPSELLPEAAASADYDGAGGLVFQRSATDGDGISSTIVHHTNNAEQFDLVVPGAGERLNLHGVTDYGSGPQAIFPRTVGSGASTRHYLERVSVNTGDVRQLSQTGDDLTTTELITVAGPYATGMVRGQGTLGWIIYEVRQGRLLNASTSVDNARCGGDGAVDCRELISIRGDGQLVYQLFPTGDDLGGLELMISQATNGFKVNAIDLERETGSWYPRRIEVGGDLVIISRTADVEGLEALPALVVDTVSLDLYQLGSRGLASIVAP